MGRRIRVGLHAAAGRSSGTQPAKLLGRIGRRVGHEGALATREGPVEGTRGRAVQCRSLGPQGQGIGAQVTLLCARAERREPTEDASADSPESPRGACNRSL